MVPLQIDSFKYTSKFRKYWNLKIALVDKSGEQAGIEFVMGACVERGARVQEARRRGRARAARRDLRALLCYQRGWYSAPATRLAYHFHEPH